jgi:hypothetical protein
LRDTMDDLGSGSADCAMSCGGFGVSCGKLVELLTCADVTQLGCDCGACCGKVLPQPPALPTPPFLPPQPPLAEYGNYSEDCAPSGGNQLALCARPRQEGSILWPALGTGLGIAVGLIVIFILTRRLYRKWLEKFRSRRRRPTSVEFEPDGIVLEGVLQAVPVGIATAAPVQSVSSGQSPPEAVIVATGIVSSRLVHDEDHEGGAVSEAEHAHESPMPLPEQR